MAVAGLGFPWADGELPLPDGRMADAEAVLAAVTPLLSPERLAAVQRAARQRTFDLTPVLEDLGDACNVSAVLRTAECLGIGAVHVVQSGGAPRRGPRGSRVACGADRWLFRTRWRSSSACLAHLQAAGFQLVALAPGASLELREVDWSRPTAVLLGSERAGLSPEALAAASCAVRLPCRGFAASLNVGAAAAMALHAATEARLQALRRRRQAAGPAGAAEAETERSAAEVVALTAHFAARALAPRQLRAALKRAGL